MKRFILLSMGTLEIVIQVIIKSLSDYHLSLEL